MRAYADELRDMFHLLQDQGLELHAKAKEVQVTETSPDGLVSVTVGPRGELVRIDLDPRIYRRPDARKLADTIAETAWRAAGVVRERITEIFSAVIPPEQFQAHLDGDVEAVLAQLASQMGGRR
ncbi:YbaB/EbfC family nucleoid-associated protein [Nonomuraea sp. MG754425]|uniref:YbaB/EbfC family nucleoid-associated protein n=1 Tax=Nonomuraea sp. MG754425 TaxID=2570319 RepID=UPI001F3FB7E6|nr:YbaB/EbfC family nucleoid-associated protein [Nonomuraea sp. MG754425]